MWKDVHRLVLQLVAAKILDVEMKKSGERPDGSTSYSAHLAWADAEAPPPRAGAGARRSTRALQRQHEAGGAWAGIKLAAVAPSSSSSNS